MGETAAWHSDERIAPGLHMNRQGSGQMSALDNVGGEKTPDRRITADSFRLLTARLKKRPTAFADVEIELPTESVPVIAFENGAYSEPVELPVVAEEASFPVPEINPEELIEAKPAHPFFPDLPLEIHSSEPSSEVETPDYLSAFEELEAAFERQNVAAGNAAVETPAELPPEPEIEEIENPPTEAIETPVELPLEPKLEEIEVAAGETIEAPVEIPPVQEIAEIKVAASEAIEVPVELPPEQRLEEIKAPPVEVSAPLKRQLANGKLGPDHLPISGIVVPGIGDIARSIYMTPTPADRTAFLAEAAAMAAIEAEAERARSEVAAVVYSEPISPTKPQVRRVKAEDDPFAKLALAEAAATAAIEQPDEDAGELARSLLDMMLSNPSAGQPQERALAADALLKLVPRIPLRALITIVDRLSIMESPPHLLVSKLIHDPRIEVAGPLLELCNHISDQVLGKVVATGQVSLQRLIARRRHISAAMSDQLIEFDDPSVILTLVRNSGATFSHHAFPCLADHATRHHAVLAPLATRPDLPAPIAFELFWFVPAELRRYLLSRFLTDSETLTKILKITHVMQGGEQGQETKFPEREQIEALVEFLSAGKLEEATNLLAEIAAIQPDNAARIISDANGEPLAIAMKAIGTNRARFGEIVDILKNSDFGIIAAQRNTAELQNIFDSMSFNKARVLLTYWDWAVLKSGPYAPAN